MKILIVGTGIIGTIYGWALHEAEFDVTHFVRTPKPELEKYGAKIDILDERKGYKKYNQTSYPIQITRTIDTNYDLVIVPTNWFQIESALKDIVPQCPNAFYYVLTSNWTGTEIYDAILSQSQYILGYPDAGGTVREGVYWTNIGHEIHISAPTSKNQNGFDMIQKTFSKANINIDVQQNMLHWLWVHNAGSTAISLAYQKHKDLEAFLNDKKILKKSFLATRECLKLCEMRGAYSNKYPEVAAFKWPIWILIPLFKYNFRHNESMQRYTAHAASMSIHDIARNYYDILNTSIEFDFNMTNYKELEELL